MVKRQIIHIDQDRCNGCGLCIPDCPEGALQLIDGKAHLISDIFCDGLGACIGTCPQNAISTVEREAEEYDERLTMDNIIRAGPNVIKAHLKHLKDHAQTEYFNTAVEVLKERNLEVPDLGPDENLECGCPGTMMQELSPESGPRSSGDTASELRQWPVQITLVHPKAPFLDNSHVVVIADCVAVANPNLHRDLIHGRTVLMGCPKLDNAQNYIDKLAEIFKSNRIKSVTVARMTVPCCGGMVAIVDEAIRRSGKEIPMITEIVSLEGKIQ
ncbi:MAG: ATP-binding protein [Thermoplasmatota archaeon]